MVYRACGPWQCQDDHLTGDVILDADDVHFDRNLSQASATDIPVMLRSMEYSWPGGLTYRDVEEVLVSLEFAGSGEISRVVQHGELCSAGETPCQANHLRSNRAAFGTLTVCGQVASTSASIQYMRIAQTAPKPIDGGTHPPPPLDGEYQPPPPGDGSYPVPPSEGGVFVPPVDGSYSAPSESTADTGSVEVGATN